VNFEISGIGDDVQRYTEIIQSMPCGALNMKRKATNPTGWVQKGLSFNHGLNSRLKMDSRIFEKERTNFEILDA